MSSRQKQRLENSLKKTIQKEEEDILEEEIVQRKTFTLVSSSSSSSSEDEQEDNEKEEDISQKSESKSGVKLSSSTTTKKKKQQQQKKNKANQQRNQVEKEEDEFLNNFISSKKEDTTSEEITTSILIERNRYEFLPDRLDADQEVARKLGRVLFSNTSTTKKKEKKRGGRYVMVQQQNPSLSSLPRLFVSQDQDWGSPPTFASGEGARMLNIEEEDGKTCYYFEASSSYKAAQAHFKELVLTYDPNHLIHLIQEHPFHVDSLLQLHDVFLSSGQNETAQIMLKRALYTLESWCSPQFRQSIGNGKLRLKIFSENDDENQFFVSRGNKDDIDAGLNGAFLRALVLSMRLAGRRDCFETAFSLSKFILSLSPELDPTFSLLSIDYYAIMNRSYEWVIQSHSSLEICSIPSVSYGKAIALFYQTRSDNALSRGDADDELRQAIQLFPKYAQMVLEHSQRVVPSVILKLSSVQKQGVDEETVERLCRLAFARQETLWNSYDLVSWLFEICQKMEWSTNNNNREGKIIPLRSR